MVELTQFSGPLVCRACHRIELAGDWSDLPAYSDVYGGRVINMAVHIPEFIIEASVSALETPAIEIESIDGGHIEIITEDAQLRSPAQTSDLLLTKAILCELRMCSPNRHSLQTFLRETFGSGIRISTNSTVPAGSGLGTSSILATTIRLALFQVAGEKLDAGEACSQTYKMEVRLGLGSGWQDQIGGIIPGIKEVTRDISGNLSFVPLPVPPELLHTMADLMLLAYTGRTRYSGDILNSVGSALRSDPKAVAVVKELESFCDPVREALLYGDYPNLGRFCRQITELHQRLDSKIIPQRIQELFAQTSKQCYGARICGAGGEGFILFVTKNSSNRDQVIEILRSNKLTFYTMRVGSGYSFVSGAAT